MATVTTAVDLAVSFTNLENGAVKYLEITKAAANVISFIGVVDAIQDKNYINTILTSVCYRVSNKNGIIYVEGITSVGANSWITIPLNENVAVEPLKYRINSMGNMELKGIINYDYINEGFPLVYNAIPITIPVACRPSITVYHMIMCSSLRRAAYLEIRANGNLVLWTEGAFSGTPRYFYINNIILL
jgi:hypothetical protein